MWKRREGGKEREKASGSVRGGGQAGTAEGKLELQPQAGRRAPSPRGAPGAMERGAAAPLLLLFFAALACAPQLARALPSKVSRGVAVPFVFDPHAVCSPPCQHGGLCIRNATCFCAKGYEGERCQHATCYPKCKNGGKCLRPGKCRCQPGYGGRYCHKVSCEEGCQNGGECISVNGMAKCICASGWTGSRCQEAICPQGCRNGGACVAPGICSCAAGWVGGACHLALCRLPCHHGGKCIAPDVCKCRSPYSGLQCTKRLKE